MYSHEAANEFCKKNEISLESVIPQQVQTMIEEEAEEIIKESKRRHGRRTRYGIAVKESYELIKQWYEEANEREIYNLRDFVGTRRRAYVYMVLLRMEKNERR